MSDVRMELSQETINFLSVLLPPLLVLIGRAVVIRADRFLIPRRRRAMGWIIGLSIGLIAHDIVDLLIPPTPETRLLLTANSVLGYMLRPPILLLFLILVEPKRKLRAEWLLVAVNALIYLLAFDFRRNIVFTYSSNPMFWVAGPLRNTCLVVCGILMADLIWITFRRYWRERRLVLLLPSLNVPLLACMLWLDYSVGLAVQILSFTTVGIVLCSMFFYNWLHLQFVLEHEKALQSEQRIRIMKTQIQPHFLFNTLSSIRSLCRTDPEKAYEVTGLFSSYLRQNIDSLDQDNLIPLEKEMEHVRIYAEIEQTRFPNIRVNYDLRDTDFSVPPLTVQPLLENAIRHGVRGRENGQVDILTRRTASGHEILIRDNGAGFDVRSAAGSGKHIGLQNVRDRIESLCRGTMTVRSEPGSGAELIITLPETTEAKREEDRL